MSRAVFFDRDGTLIQDVHYLKDPKDIILIDGVSDSLKRIKDNGYLVFMHTNQSGISRGYYNWDDVHACNSRMLELMNLKSDFWDGVCIAPESPEGSNLGYRKPSEKYELQMIEKYKLDRSQCWMVGDKWIDAETGLRSKMNAALVQTGKEISTDTEKKASAKNVRIFADLNAFSNHCLFDS